MAQRICLYSLFLDDSHKLAVAKGGNGEGDGLPHMDTCYFLFGYWNLNFYMVYSHQFEATHTWHYVVADVNRALRDVSVERSAKYAVTQILTCYAFCCFCLRQLCLYFDVFDFRKTAFLV